MKRSTSFVPKGHFTALPVNLVFCAYWAPTKRNNACLGFHLMLEKTFEISARRYCSGKLFGTMARHDRAQSQTPMFDLIPCMYMHGITLVCIFKSASLTGRLAVRRGVWYQMSGLVSGIWSGIWYQECGLVSWSLVSGFWY